MDTLFFFSVWGTAPSPSIAGRLIHTSAHSAPFPMSRILILEISINHMDFTHEMGAVIEAGVNY